MRLAVMHNLYFYNSLARQIREAIEQDAFDAFRSEYAEKLARKI